MKGLRDHIVNAHVTETCSCECKICRVICLAVVIDNLYLPYTNTTRVNNVVCHMIYYCYVCVYILYVHVMISPYITVIFNTLDATRHLSGVRTYSPHTPRAT